MKRREFLAVAACASLLAGDGFPLESLQEVQFVDALVTIAPQLASLERPWLGPYRTVDHELLTPASAGLAVSSRRPSVSMASSSRKWFFRWTST